MDLVIIVIASALASALTLFSGFGLGTMLLPVFALFMPLPTAVGATALVHLSNNLFKLALFGKYADRRVSISFGVPALVFAVAGGLLLAKLPGEQPFYSYEINGRVFEMNALKCVMGSMIVFFALFECLPAFKNLAFSTRWLGLGGALSGFFGGLSGHQGALRSAFLLRQNLGKEAFIGTGVVLACVVDVSRLSVYYFGSEPTGPLTHRPFILAAVVSAFVGIMLGKRFFHKVTISLIQDLVALGLTLMGLAMIAGVL